jgi:hypothetical protein
MLYDNSLDINIDKLLHIEPTIVIEYTKKITERVIKLFETIQSKKYNESLLILDEMLELDNSNVGLLEIKAFALDQK